MSTMINIGPMVAKVIQDMLDEQGTRLDVDSVYKRLDAQHGDEIYSAAKMLAEVAIRAKIKAHLKSSHSINAGADEEQIPLLGDAPTTIAVKQADGGFVYVPLRLATVDEIDAATKLRADNIANVQKAFDKWESRMRPIREVMDAEKVNYGEAERILFEREKQKPPSTAAQA